MTEINKNNRPVEPGFQFEEQSLEPVAARYYQDFSLLALDSSPASVEIQVRDAEHLQQLLDGLALHDAAPDAAILLDFFQNKSWSDSTIRDEIGHSLAAVTSVKERVITGEGQFVHDRQLVVRPDGVFPGYHVVLESSVSQGERSPIALKIDWGDTSLPFSSGGRLQRWHQFSELLFAATGSHVEETPFFVETNNAQQVATADGSVKLEVFGLADGRYQLDSDKSASTQSWMLPVTSPYSGASYTERVDELIMRLDYPFAKNVEFIVSEADDLEFSAIQAINSLRESPEQIAALLEVEEALLIVTRSSTVESIQKEFEKLINQEQYEGSQFMSRFDWIPNSVDIEACDVEQVEGAIASVAPKLSVEYAGDFLNLVEGNDGISIDLGLEFYSHPERMEFRKETGLSPSSQSIISVCAEVVIGKGEQEVQFFLTHAPGGIGVEGSSRMQILWPENSHELTVSPAMERWKVVDKVAEAWTGFPVPESLSVLEIDELEPGRLMLGNRMGITLEGH